MYFLAAPRRSVDADINQIMNVESKLGSRTIQHEAPYAIQIGSLLREDAIRLQRTAERCIVIKRWFN
ncbi:hypothetical protein Plhal304r1_c010g0040301 [Plasmopara halstedii]